MFDFGGANRCTLDSTTDQLGNLYTARSHVGNHPGEHKHLVENVCVNKVLLSAQVVLVFDYYIENVQVGWHSLNKSLLLGDFLNC